MRKLAILTATVASSVLAGCQPAPRSVSYFDANPSERSTVLSNCQTGSHRGTECKNAQASTEKASKLKTMNDYRRGF
jgi:hypothetical protein